MSNQRLTRDLLEAILWNADDGITVREPSGRLIYANEVAAKMAGYASSHALLTATAEEAAERLLVMDENGDPLPPERWPASIPLGGGEPRQSVIRFRVHATGVERWAVLRTTPVFDEHGNLEFVVSTAQDITEAMRGEARLHLLADASTLLASSIDFDETLARVARLAVPQLADWAAVDLVEPDGVMRRLAVACADRVTETRARELQSRYPLREDSPIGAGRVIQSGAPILIEEVTQDLLREVAIDDENLRLLEEIGVHSVMLAPLRARGRLLGAISLISGASGRRYKRADLHLATELANLAALAVDNARLYQEARDAVTARDRVLSSVSHDLRTPLTTIRGMAQVLLRRVDPSSALSAPQVMERLRLLDRATVQMSLLIDDLLDLARLEAGRRLELNLGSTGLVDLVRRVVKAAGYENGAHPIDLEVPATEVTGDWDARRLERALRNLLRHATKSGPYGAGVRVRMAVTEDDQRGQQWARIELQVDAAHIPPAQPAPGLDRRFSQLTASERRGDVDIGVSGARQIIEQHEGELIAHGSTGEGATFTIRLPLRRVETAV